MTKAYELMFEAIKNKYFRPVSGEYDHIYQPTAPYGFKDNEEIRVIINLFSKATGLWRLASGENTMPLTNFINLYLVEILESELPFDPETLQPRQASKGQLAERTIKMTDGSELTMTEYLERQRLGDMWGDSLPERWQELKW